jgi:hypothetical protein
MRPPRALLLLSLLLACEPVDDGKSVDSGATPDSGGGAEGGDDGSDTGTRDDPRPDPGVCTVVEVSPRVVERTGADPVSVAVRCEDATALTNVWLELPELELTVPVAGEPDDGGTGWTGRAELDDLEELVFEKGLSFGMDVSSYKLDEDRRTPEGERELLATAAHLGALGLRMHDARGDFATLADIQARPIYGAEGTRILRARRAAGGPTDIDGDDVPDDVLATTIVIEGGNLEIRDNASLSLGGSSLVVGSVGWTADAPAGTQQVFPAPAHSAAGGQLATAVDGAAVPLAVHGLSVWDRSASGTATYTVDPAALGLADGTSTTPPQPLGVHHSAKEEAGSVSTLLQAVTLSGLGTRTEDGKPVLFGVQWADGDGSAPSHSWTAEASWPTLLPELSVAIAGMGTEVLVFFRGKDSVRGNDSLGATSIDAATGKTLGTLELASVPLPLQGGASLQVDLNGDGSPELLTAVVDDNGVLQVIYGAPSSSVGLSKADVHQPLGDRPAPWAGLDHELELQPDGDGGIVLLVHASTSGLPISQTLHFPRKGDAVDFTAAPASVVVAREAAAVQLGPPLEDCTTAPCSLILTGSSRAAAGLGGTLSISTLAWKGEEPPVLPVAAEGDHTIVISGGSLEIRDNSNLTLRAALPLDQTAPVHKHSIDEGWVVFGRSQGIAEVEDGLPVLLTYDSASLDSPGVTVLPTMAARSMEFQIPEKVVMEKDDDFYGLASGDGGEPGLTVVWTSVWDSDEDKRPDAQAVQVARVPLAELARGGSVLRREGEPTVLSSVAGLSSLGGGLSGGGLVHSGGLGPVIVPVQRGQQRRESWLWDGEDTAATLPLSAAAGVETVASTGAATTDDLLAVLPWDTGTDCPYALVLVPGASRNWDENIDASTVLSTSDSTDCAGLVQPLGTLDADGDGVAWPVLAASVDEGLTVAELSWDGESWLQLPATTLPLARLARADVGDVDGDGLDELILRAAGDPSRALVLRSDGHALSPSAEATALRAGAVTAEAWAEALEQLSDEPLDVVDSEDAGITGPGEAAFLVLDDLGASVPLGPCGAPAVGGCGWSWASKDEESEPPPKQRELKLHKWTHVALSH